MPYSNPQTSTLFQAPPVEQPAFRLGGHRRSHSGSTITFSAEQGPGAFAPLPSLPRRARRGPVFRLADDDDDNDDDNDSAPPAMGLGLHVGEPTPSKNLKGLSLASSFGADMHDSQEKDAIPFPLLSPTQASFSPRPTMYVHPSRRDASYAQSVPTTPTFRETPLVRKSNGQPLKPSLKSTQSSPHLPLAPAHQRSFTRSEPASPMPKAVHFAEKGLGLESIVIFEKSQRPTAVSLNSSPAGHPGITIGVDENETETEGENGFTTEDDDSYPFPRMTKSSAPANTEPVLRLSTALTSPVPTPPPPPASPFSSIENPSASQPTPNVHLETLVLPSSRPPVIRGSVLVRNIAFAKNVIIRFTLDDWQTTSEVSCAHAASLPSLPPPFSSYPVHRESARNLGSGLVGQWDRFTFQIKLEDFERTLDKKRMWLVVRYSLPDHGGEWWDNNSNMNYSVGFERVGPTPAPAPVPKVKLTRSPNTSPPKVSAPVPVIASPRPAPPAPLHFAPNSAPIVLRSPVPPTPKLRLSNYSPPTLRFLGLQSPSAGVPLPLSPPDSPPPNMLPKLSLEIVNGMPATTVSPKVPASAEVVGTAGVKEIQEGGRKRAGSWDGVWTGLEGISIGSPKVEEKKVEAPVEVGRAPSITPPESRSPSPQPIAAPLPLPPPLSIPTFIPFPSLSPERRASPVPLPTIAGEKIDGRPYSPSNFPNGLAGAPLEFIQRYCFFQSSPVGSPAGKVPPPSSTPAAFEKMKLGLPAYVNGGTWISSSFGVTVGTGAKN